MPGTKAGAAHSSWHTAMKACGKAYREGKEAATEEVGGGKSELQGAEPSKAAKAKEVEAEKKKERTATANRHAEDARALPDVAETP